MNVDNLNKNALTNTFTQTLSRCEMCFFFSKGTGSMSDHKKFRIV